MKIAVIGANGRTGRVFVELALAAGHDVIAGVHRQSRLPAHARLTVLPCDATQPKEVTALLKGTNAVVMLLGHVRGSSPTMQTDATRTVIACMKKAGISRLVSLTGTGVRQPKDSIPKIDTFLNALVARVDPARIADGIAHTQLIQNSKLDWTIARVLKLETLAQRDVRLTAHGPTALWVSRAQVARELLRILEEKQFIGEMPILSPIR